MLGEFYAFGAGALAGLLVDRCPTSGRLGRSTCGRSTSTSRSRRAPRSAGRRANYGASPGDDAARASPTSTSGRGPAEVGGELWNATGFTGAELGYAELLAAEDPSGAAVDFFRSRSRRSLRRLSGAPASRRGLRVSCAGADRRAHRRRRLPRAERRRSARSSARGSTSTATPIVGFRDGWRGPARGRHEELTIESTRGILPRGGTILGTSRTNPFKARRRPGAGRRDDGRRCDLDGLIAIGGEDTLGVGSQAPRRPRRHRRRRAEDDRQRPRRHRRHVRLRHRAPGRDRRDRPPAHDGRVPPPGDGGRGDGPPRRLDRAALGARRRRRRDPDPRAAVRHRRGLRR